MSEQGPYYSWNVGPEDSFPGTNPEPAEPKNPVSNYPETAFCINKIFLCIRIMLWTSIISLVFSCTFRLMGIGALGLVGLVGIGILVATIVAFINEMIGLNRGGHEFDGYRNAFILIIVYLAADIVAVFLDASDAVVDALGILSSIAQWIILLTSIKACSMILREDLAEYGRKTVKLWIAAIAAAYLLDIVLVFVDTEDPSAATVWFAVIGALLVTVLAIVGYVFLYRFYKKADEAFNG